MNAWIGITCMCISALFFTALGKSWIPKGPLRGLAGLLGLYTAVIAFGAFLSPLLGD